MVPIRLLKFNDVLIPKMMITLRALSRPGYGPGCPLNQSDDAAVCGKLSWEVKVVSTGLTISLDPPSNLKVQQVLKCFTCKFYLFVGD